MLSEMDATRDMPAEAHSDESTPFLCRRHVRIVIYSGLVVFLLLMVVWPLISQRLDPDFRKHIAQHRVMVGMTKEQVLQAWGSPQTINTSFTADGVRREEWIFEDWESTAVVKHRYLYFEEGTLVGGWYQGSGERNPSLPAEPPAKKKHATNGT